MNSEQWPVVGDQEEVVSGQPVVEESQEEAAAAPAPAVEKPARAGGASVILPLVEVGAGVAAREEAATETERPESPAEPAAPAQPVAAVLEPIGPTPEATPEPEPEPAGPTPEATPEPEPEPLPPPVIYDFTGPATDVNGVIITHTTWTITNSPYILTGDVVVTASVTLTVDPGVVVMGADGKKLKVLGHLQAVGTVTQPITFTSSANNGPNQWDGLVFDGGTGLLRHVTVRYAGDDNGITRSNLTARNVLAGEVRIESSEVRNVGTSYAPYSDYGLYAVNSRVVVSDTLFASNGNNASEDWPVYLQAADLHRVTLIGNTFSGNAVNRVLVAGGSLTAEATLAPQTGLVGYELSSDLTVPADVTFAPQPGVTLMGRDDTKVNVLGHLQAVGTETQPVIFTSLTNTGPNQWAGLLFEGGTGLLRHVIVRYGGDSNGYVYSNITARNVTGGEVRIESSEVRNVGTSYAPYSDYGLYAVNSRVVVSDTLFTANGNNAAEDYALYATGSSTLITITGSTFQSNTGYPLRAPVANLGRVQRNSFINNSYNRILLAGDATLTTDANVAPQYGLAGYQFEGSLVVTAGVTLTVAPATTLFWNSGKGLTVHGRLQAIGTQDDPILFTSSANSGPGQWNGVAFGDGWGRLQHATVRYATTGLHVNGGDDALREAAVLSNSSYGIQLSGAGTIFRVAGSQISGNSYGLLNQTGSLVDARYNWWGHLTGPYHPTLNPLGQGNRVSDLVLFEPWLDRQVTDLGITNQTASDNTVLTYNSADGTYTRHYPDGAIVHFNVDGSHDYTLDPSGNKTAYIHNADGTLARIEVYPAGHANPRWTWVFSYQSPVNSDQLSVITVQWSLNTDHWILVTDPAGRVTILEIDEHGDLVSVAYPDGSRQGFAYDATHHMTHKRDPLGHVTTYAYDRHGRMRQLTLPPRDVYDPDTGQISIQPEVHTYTPSDVSYVLVNDLMPGDPNNPNGALVGSGDLYDERCWQRDGLLLVCQQQRTDRWGFARMTTVAYGRVPKQVAQRVDEPEVQSTYERDEAGRVLRATTAEGKCIEFTYDGRIPDFTVLSRKGVER